MSQTISVPRELLERIDDSAICDGTDATISDDLFNALVALLSQPAEVEQPEETRNPCEPLMTIAQHHRITAQLRAEYERLRQQIRDCQQERYELEAERDQLLALVEKE